MAQRNSGGPLRESSKLTSHGALEEELSKSSILRELEEARIRECQMEKTVRWWTACTAGWRKKWSKVRHERDGYKRQATTIKTQLTIVFNEIQSIIDQSGNDESHIIVLKSKLENVLAKHRPIGDRSFPDVNSSNDRPPDDDEETENVKETDLPMADDKSKAELVMKINELQKDLDEKTAICEELASYKEQTNLLMDLKDGANARVTKGDINKEKNESLLEIMSDESNLNPELERDRLLIENNTLRSQVRDLCYEICVAQEEIDNVSEQIMQLKERNDEFLEHKETCKKEIERLTSKLQLCGFYTNEEGTNQG